MNIHQFLQINNYGNLSITLNKTDISEGIVFIYPSWSNDFINLKTLLNCLKSSLESPKLYIMDIDDESCRIFEQQFGILNHGKGEIYLIRDGEIKSQILNHSGNTEVKIYEMMKFGM